MPAPTWFKTFEFDLASALRDALIALFEEMDQGPLNAGAVAEIPEAQGIYQLFQDGRLVYVGKTDAEAGLNARLARHAKKIQHRLNLDPHSVTFKAVQVYVFTAVDLEQQLIAHYKANGAPPDWNDSGFGANDPGKERDTTRLKAHHYDIRYPINIDIPIDAVPAGPNRPIAEVLRLLKDRLPYTLRYENAGGRSRQPHPELVSKNITVATSPDTVRNTLTQVRAALGAPWQVTNQSGYITIYRKQRTYPHGVPL